MAKRGEQKQNARISLNRLEAAPEVEGTVASWPSPSLPPFPAAALASLSKLSSFLDSSIDSLSSSSNGKGSSSGSNSSNGQPTNTTASTLARPPSSQHTPAATPSSSSSSSSSSSPPTSSDQPVSTVLSDLRSLFTLVSKETTALSLAFAPPKESWDAVEGTVKKLHVLLGKVLFCNSVLSRPPSPTLASSSASSSSPSSSSSNLLLARDWRAGTLQVFAALKELLDTAHSIYTGLASPTTPIKPVQRKQILTATSVVWKVIERTECLPNDELEAFSRAWKADLEVFNDALEEAEQLTTRDVKGKGRAMEGDEDGDDDGDGDDDEEEEERTGQQRNGHDDDHDDDDGFFDFGGGEEDPVTEEEMGVINASVHLMKLVQALYKRISQDAGQSSATQKKKVPSLPADQLAQLYEASQKLLSLQDELASSLYPPLDLQEVHKHAASYETAAARIAVLAAGEQSTSCKDDAAELASKLDDLSIKEGSDVAESLSACSRNDWFGVCQKQIAQAAGAVRTACQGRKWR